MVRLGEGQHQLRVVPQKSKLIRFFEHLHRSGTYAHLWTDAGSRSHWFRVDTPAQCRERQVPKSWLNHNVYFTVHPLSQIPPQNASGNHDRRFISSQLAYIAAVNALFAEYDGKDYVMPPEYQPYLPPEFTTSSGLEQRTFIKSAQEAAFYAEPIKFKMRAWAIIDKLAVPPSVIVDSGGGYHCYWFLRQTLLLDESNRADIQAVQHAWVQMVNADPGAADLRRLLRMPGTYNVKAGFADLAPRVVFVKTDFGRLYDYRLLEEMVNDWLFAQRPPQATTIVRRRLVARPDNEQRANFNRQHSLVNLLTQHGYQISFQTPALTRLARPGRDKQHSSVTVFAERADGTPELSIHFSSNDPLYSPEYRDPATGQLRRHAYDAFGVQQRLVTLSINA